MTLHTVSVAIMAHPSRAAYVAELQGKLDRPATVVWDEKQDRIDTGTRALLAGSPDATHHMVIQDDAIPLKDLVAGVEKILNNPRFSKDIPLCLYAGNVGTFTRHFNRQWKSSPFSWLLMQGMNWGVAVVIPRLELVPLVNFMLKPERREPQYDLRISRYFEFRRIKVWYPIPSLVDHRHGPSLLEGHGEGRHAWKFLGEEASALDFDFDGKFAIVNLTRKFIG